MWYGRSVDRGVALAVSAALTGFLCVLLAVPGTAAEKAKGPLEWAKDKVGLPTRAPAPAANPTAASTAPGAVTAPGAAAALNLRSAESMTQLFAKKTVTGEDLKEELNAMKTAESRAALAQSVNQATAEAVGDAKPGMMSRIPGVNRLPGSVTGKLQGLAGDMVNKTVGFSDKALDDFFNTLTGDSAALRNETVELPDSAGMTQEHQRSVLTMAALLVATRIGGKMMKAGQDQFANLEADYAKLLERRQKTAELMADVLDRRRQVIAAGEEAQARGMEKDLQKWLTPEDLKFIDSFGADRSLREFASDLGMQNLAIKFLRHSDPKAYAEYKTERDGLIGRTGAYVKSMTGVTAFGAFSTLFVREVTKTVKSKNMHQILTAMPFSYQFMTEVKPLVELSAKTLYTGIVVEPSKAQNNYRLLQGGQETDLARSKDVFTALTTAGEDKRLAGALFRDGSPGFVSRVYQCDSAAAGLLLDRAVSEAERRKFAEGYLGLNGATMEGKPFSFSSALVDGQTTPSGAKLVEPLLNKDQRNIAEAVQIGNVQRLTAGNFDEWNDSQFTRLVLANAEGPYAQMQLGTVLIRLVPSMSTIYAYESYVDSCGRTASAATAPAKPTKKPAKK
jgi:hypothetical protein